MRFEIVRSRSKKEPFFWRIVASNGQTLATSEMYKRKASCLSAIALDSSGNANHKCTPWAGASKDLSTPFNSGG